MAINMAKLETARPTAPPRTAPTRPGADRPLLRRLLALQIPSPHSRTVPVDELVLFTRQLALLLQTGNGLAPSIAALAAQSRSPVLRRVAEDIHSRLEQGSRLSDSLAHHPQVFSPLFSSLVRAGEATGGLQVSFERLAGMLEIQRRLRARIREAMTYPTVIAVVMGLVLIFIMTFMVPRFATIFAGMGDDLPGSTRLFLGLGELIRSRWWLGPPILLLVTGGIRWLWRREAVQVLWDRTKLSTPVVGALYTEACLFQLCSTLSLLLESHVPPMEAVAIARKAIRNSSYDAFFDDLERNLESGRGIAPAFQEAGFIPDTVKLMVATGESSGALDVVMARLAERYREDLESNIRRLSSLLEPLMLVAMGIMVGFMAISFILPIFRMSRALR